jgi:hypothetical protein
MSGFSDMGFSACFIRKADNGAIQGSLHFSGKERRLRSR